MLHIPQIAVVRLVSMSDHLPPVAGLEKFHLSARYFFTSARLLVLV